MEIFEFLNYRVCLEFKAKHSPNSVSIPAKYLQQSNGSSFHLHSLNISAQELLTYNLYQFKYSKTLL